jgi:hypothetical protein
MRFINFLRSYSLMAVSVIALILAVAGEIAGFQPNSVIMYAVCIFFGVLFQVSAIRLPHSWNTQGGDSRFSNIFGVIGVGCNFSFIWIAIYKYGIIQAEYKDVVPMGTADVLANIVQFPLRTLFATVITVLGVIAPIYLSSFYLPKSVLKK